MQSSWQLWSAVTFMQCNTWKSLEADSAQNFLFGWWFSPELPTCDQWEMHMHVLTYRAEGRSSELCPECCWCFATHSCFSQSMLQVPLISSASPMCFWFCIWLGNDSLAGQATSSLQVPLGFNLSHASELPVELWKYRWPGPSRSSVLTGMSWCGDPLTHTYTLKVYRRY